MTIIVNQLHYEVDSHPNSIKNSVFVSKTTTSGTPNHHPHAAATDCGLNFHDTFSGVNDDFMTILLSTVKLRRPQSASIRRHFFGRSFGVSMARSRLRSLMARASFRAARRLNYITIDLIQLDSSTSTDSMRSFVNGIACFKQARGASSRV